MREGKVTSLMDTDWKTLQNCKSRVTIQDAILSDYICMRPAELRGTDKKEKFEVAILLTDATLQTR